MTREDGVGPRVWKETEGVRDWQCVVVPWAEVIGHEVLGCHPLVLSMRSILFLHSIVKMRCTRSSTIHVCTFRLLTRAQSLPHGCLPCGQVLPVLFPEAGLSQ